MPSTPLTPAFFQRDVIIVARDLIGIELHWNGCSGIIVETEAYAAEGDSACHTASRLSARAFVQNHPPGSAYVYLNYGMYWLFNLLAKGGQRDGLILVRALEPKDGIPIMQERRGGREGRHLCSGPGKLALALGITGDHHGLPLTGPERSPLGQLRQPKPSHTVTVVADVRVGISKAAEFPWRFLAANHPHVSVSYGKVPGAKRKPPTPKI
ncbi:DNA-3-methyladenine glycosylase [Phragmitibacter flavus]|uniref:Putative 3-methyladenine DNA glycosylase n=1 Tax=Phragmitibacter flavus TaxID=2576071 RepID=A0A5R8KA65_9BACT|nr:DNA-3-methyladenine glycosylase [Phragmitibacter flavus]TLD69210.1 DNA-3-methyladenine glycosylase [Phragmitibacter flavus]